MEPGAHATVHAGEPSVRVVSASPEGSDHASLRSILHGLRWHLAEASSPEDARRAVIDAETPVLVLAGDVSCSEWRALAVDICHAPNPPKIVLAAHPAAENLWAEALDLDCFDVLAKPYATEEVIRLIHLAWNRWLSERKYRDTNQRPARAALRTMAGTAQ